MDCVGGGVYMIDVSIYMCRGVCMYDRGVHMYVYGRLYI